jgi:catechol 2,3-dioxygenase-like lactoylglutathione lyase family enzyme
MADRALGSANLIHHIALRVADVEAGKTWLTTMLGFRVERELQIMGLDFAWLSPGGAKTPVIELVGGPVESERQLPENILDILKLSGWHHLCLQVPNVEDYVSELRRREVKILIDVTAGAPGSGAKRIAFIADPWGNIYELFEPADDGDLKAS